MLRSSVDPLISVFKRMMTTSQLTPIIGPALEHSPNHRYTAGRDSPLLSLLGSIASK